MASTSPRSTARRGRTLELAEAEVFARLQSFGVDTEMVSDTGTVENLLDFGLSLEDLAAGRFTWDALKGLICWLD